MKSWLRSAGAVLIGLVGGAVVIMTLTYGAVAVFFGGDFTAAPTPPYLVVNLTYSFGAAGLAGWLAGRLSPRMPLAHAVAVAVIMIIMSLAGGGESQSAAGVPTWYGPVLMVLMPFGALSGGWLSARGAPGRESSR